MNASYIKETIKQSMNDENKDCKAINLFQNALVIQSQCRAISIADSESKDIDASKSDNKLISSRLR